jgi:AraC family transcriptional regulator, positive regulator of tynA and feaB
VADVTVRQLRIQSGSFGRRIALCIINGERGGSVTETLFQFDHHNYLNCQSAYRGDGNQEWYLGDYSIEAGSLINVRAERRTVGAFSIIRVRSFTRMSFKRTLSHIRQDGIDVAVLWFVKQGSLKIRHSGGDTVALAGDFAVTKSATPFFMECMTDANSLHEVFEVVMPAFTLRHLFPHSLTTGYRMSVEGREFAIAERMLRDLFEDSGELSEQISQVLLDSALLVLSEAVKTRGTHAEVQRSLAAKRLQDALRFIDTHISSPELSIATVATGCGISQRYLFFLLKLHGVSFSTLVWDKRLQIAKEWLSTSKPAEAAVSEIAYRVGFKSPAHFSRMFKRAFRMSPCECRAGPSRRSADPVLPGLQ